MPDESQRISPNEITPQEVMGDYREHFDFESKNIPNSLSYEVFEAVNPESFLSGESQNPYDIFDTNRLTEGHNLHENIYEIQANVLAFIATGELTPESDANKLIRVIERYEHRLSPEDTDPEITLINTRFSKIETYILQNASEDNFELTKSLELIREYCLMNKIARDLTGKEVESDFGRALAYVSSSLASEDITQENIDIAYENTLKLISFVGREDYNGDTMRDLSAAINEAKIMVGKGRDKMEKVDQIINIEINQMHLPEGFTNIQAARDLYRVVVHNYGEANFSTLKPDQIEAVYKLCTLFCDSNSEEDTKTPEVRKRFQTNIAILNSIMEEDLEDNNYSIDMLLGATYLSHELNKIPPFSEQKRKGIYFYGTSEDPTLNHPQHEDSPYVSINRGIERLSEMIDEIRMTRERIHVKDPTLETPLSRIAELSDRVREEYIKISRYMEIMGIRKPGDPKDARKSKFGYFPIGYGIGNTEVPDKVKPNNWETIST